MDWKQRMGDGLDHWIELCASERKYASIKLPLIELREDIEDELTVMIAGEFNAGKSTFINALLGDQVLSSDVTPETAMVTKLKYGVKRKVVAHYLNGVSKEYDDAWLEQLTAERDGEFKDIRRQLSHVELQIPYEILKKITIIDTPGLNANNEFHTKATERFLGRTDHVFFLFHALSIGTATEIKWLKKFMDHGITPFGIINRIDEIDEEEDDLESLIEFNKPRIGPSIQKWFGVSAKDALAGKLQNDSQLLKWSNWSEIERLLESILGESNKKLERAFERLLPPLRQMDRLMVEQKISLPLRKLPEQQVESFVTKDFPELLSMKQRLDHQKNVTGALHVNWNRILDTTINTMDDLGQFLQAMCFSETDESRDIELKSNTLKVWEGVESRYRSFNRKSNDYHDQVLSLNYDREILSNSWKAIQYSYWFLKKRKLEKHLRKLEYFHHQREKLAEKNLEITGLFNEMSKKIKVIDQNIKTLVMNQFQIYLKNEQKEIHSWNTQLDQVKKPFAELTRDEFVEIESYAKLLNDFYKNIAVPLLKAGRALDHFLPFEEVNYLLGNMEKLGHNLPRKEFYSQWLVLDCFSKETEQNYEFHFPTLIPPELKSLELQGLPGELKHNVNKEMRAYIAARNQWLKYGAAALFMSLMIAGIVHSFNKDSTDHTDSDYSMDVDDAAGDYESEQSAEEEKQTLEDRYSREDVETFLKNVHQEIEQNEYSHGRFFSKNGWENYSSYYENFSNGTLETFDTISIGYPSADEIKATVKETIKQSGILKEYETTYTLKLDTYASDDLLISAFSYTLANESETSIALEDGELEEFLGKFRNSYMQALNEGDATYINDYFDQESPAYTELQKYIASISGKGYKFEELEFQVNQVTTESMNEYRILTSEKFLFTDEKEEKTSYDRSKDYIVKVLPEKRLVIKGITIKDTKKETIKTPTVQLVTNQDVNDFILRYYGDLESAFNGNGFSYVQDYYDPNGSGFDSAEAYITNANEKNMHMGNVEMSVESISEADENHYLVTCNIVDEYAYQNGTGDRKRIHAVYKIRITNNGDMLIAENPTIKILEKTVLGSEQP